MIQLGNQSVLAPTDFSDQANAAVDIGLELAGDPARLTVLHVAPPMGTFSAGDPAVVWNTVSDETRREHLQQEFRQHFSTPIYKSVHFEVVFGNPAEEIAQFAAQHGIDMIVLPSHGRTGLAHLMIGSVAERVVRLAHCPVLVLRD